MQDFNTIIGVIQMRQNECSFSVIQKRYHIGSGTTQRILSRFEASGLTLEELRQMDRTLLRNSSILRNKSDERIFRYRISSTTMTGYMLKAVRSTLPIAGLSTRLNTPTATNNLNSTSTITNS